MRLSKYFEGTELRKQLIRGGVGSLFIKLVHFPLSLGLAIVLARTLGAEGYGIYAYAFALVSLLAIPATFGLPALVVRETAKAQSDQNWARLKGVWRWSTLVAAAMSFLLVSFGGIGLIIYGPNLSAMQNATLVWALVLIPVLALGNLRGAALRGLRRVVQGQIPENVVRPLLFLLLLLSAAAFSPDDRLSPDQAMAYHFLAALASFFVGVALLYRARPREIICVCSLDYKHRDWVVSSVPLGLISGLQFVHSYTDIFLIGLFTSAADVGVYRVASQGAMLVTISMQAVNLVVMPHFARLYSKNDIQRLQRLLTVSARAAFVLACPVGLTLVFFASPVLRIFFGQSFESGAAVLGILATGGLIYVGIGFGWTLLNMAGYERLTFKWLGFGALLNIFLNFGLIPLFGIEGAAVATVLSLIASKLMLLRVVKKKIGIDSSIFTGRNVSRLGGLI